MSNEKEMNDVEMLKKTFANYQKKQTERSGKKRKTGSDILKKYFTPRETIETFRTLPVKGANNFYDVAFFHERTVNVKGGNVKHGKKIYCPAHNDPKVPKLDESGEKILDQNGKPIMIPASCPLCAKNKRILAKQDPSIKGKKRDDLNDKQKEIFDRNKKIFIESNKWKARAFYILRGVDKGSPKDGIKFWRFKDHYRNQGTFDKLMPALNAYIEAFGKSFYDVNEGTDLSITMADSEFNGIQYKSVSAINHKGPSKLSDDSIIAQQWIDDPITWRDVFLPSKAPNVTPHEYLKMLTKGDDPYWDDSDPNNKKWVFPNNPELEAKANDRNRNLDADEGDNFEQASDLTNEGGIPVTINNVSKKDVGEFDDDATDMGKEVMDNNGPTQPEPTQPAQEETSKTDTTDDSESFDDDDEFDDLPF